jgi:hypothetical protein
MILYSGHSPSGRCRAGAAWWWAGAGATSSAAQRSTRSRTRHWAQAAYLKKAQGRRCCCCYMQQTALPQQRPAKCERTGYLVICSGGNSDADGGRCMPAAVLLNTPPKPRRSCYVSGGGAIARRALTWLVVQGWVCPAACTQPRR